MQNVHRFAGEVEIHRDHGELQAAPALNKDDGVFAWNAQRAPQRGFRVATEAERTAALAYATESMRLTTRLMQLASWLLLHRAVNEGEMSLAQASREKTKVKLSASDAGDEATLAMLPKSLRELIVRSIALQNRVRRLDATIHSGVGEKPQANAVERQLGLLKAAFERGP